MITAKLLDVAAGRTKRLAVSLPPGHGKSENISVAFPTWYMGRWPDARLLNTSYQYGVACGWSARCRNLLAEIGPEVFGVSIDGAKKSADEWKIAGHRGTMYAAGMGGAITSRRLEGIIIDDPIKGPEEANSETTREKQWEWYLDVAKTRLEPGGWIVLLMTRWHEDDIFGRILESPEASEWDVLQLPALVEEEDLPDPLGREIGEALWPERFDAEFLRRVKHARGTYGFSALYQGRPQPAEGNLIKRPWLRYYDTMATETAWGWSARCENTVLDPAILQRYGVMDLAASEKTSADYTVLTVFARTNQQLFSRKHLILEVARAQIGGDEYEAFIRRMVDKWRLPIVYVEEKGMQLAVVKQLKAANAENPLPVVGLPETENDKVSRVMAVCPFLERGQLWLPRGAPWLGAFEREILAFPRGKHDDQVDTVPWGVVYVPGGFQTTAAGVKIPARISQMDALLGNRRPEMS